MERRGRPIESIVTTTIEYEDEEEEEQTTLREAVNVAFQVSFILLTGATIYMILSIALKKPNHEEA